MKQWIVAKQSGSDYEGSISSTFMVNKTTSKDRNEKSGHTAVGVELNSVEPVGVGLAA